MTYGQVAWFLVLVASVVGIVWCLSYRDDNERWQ